jgi:hypothetical protein
VFIGWEFLIESQREGTGQRHATDEKRKREGIDVTVSTSLVKRIEETHSKHGNDRESWQGEHSCRYPDFIKEKGR